MGKTYVPVPEKDETASPIGYLIELKRRTKNKQFFPSKIKREVAKLRLT